MHPALFPLLFGAITTGGVALLERSRDQTWKRAAKTLGGSFARPSWTRARRIEVTLQGLPVVVEAEAGKTRARARAGAPLGGFRILVMRHGTVTRLATLPGRLLDVPTGDGAFDEQHWVTSNDPALARAWLCERARRAIGRFSRYSFWLRDSEARAERGGLERAESDLAGIAEAARELLAGGEALQQAWCKAAEHLRGTSSGGPFFRTGLSTIRDVRGSPGVVIDGVRRERVGTCTRISAPRAGGRLERFEWRRASNGEAGRWVLESSRPESTRQRAGARVDADLEALEPLAAIGEDRTVSLLLPGVVTNTQRLRMGIGLVERLCAPLGTGPYR